MPHVLVLSGPAGVGKSTLSWEIGWRLRDAGVPHACLDGDELDRTFPEPPDLARRNLAAFWANGPVDRLVLCGVYVDLDANLAWMREAIPDAAFTVVGLDAPDDVLEARVRERELPGRADAQLARTLAYARAIRERRDRPLVDTGGRSVESVADEVLELAGWLPPTVVVRLYDDSTDRDACRSLWVELTEHHRRLYDDPTIGGDDPGSYFTDTYLGLPNRAASWVAVVDGEVVGLTGLLDHGSEGEVEPMVVAARARGRGIGNRLAEAAVAESRRRGHDHVSIRPVYRNVESIRAFHAMGFETLGGFVDLTMDLRPRRHTWHEGAALHGLTFRW